MTMLDAALGYVEAGWPVFPANPANKQPLTANGFKDATDDPGQVREWWHRFPTAMIGVPTGERSGVWVLDVDTKRGDGYGELAALVAANRPLPETPTVRTPSGGTHYLFQHVDGVRNRGRLTDNIDVRGEGGYIIAAGSIDADGCPYEWVAQPADPAPAPEWLLGRVVRGRSSAAAVQPRRQNTRYVDAAIADELARLMRTGHGRNNALNDAAFALGTFVGAGALSESEAESRLFGAAMANGYVAKDGEHAARATIRSGLASGSASPREIPDAPPERNPERDAELAKEGARLAAGLLAGKQPAEPEGIHATPYIPRDPASIPRRQWLYGRHYVRKYVSLTVAPGGLGKSSNAIAEALAMITGRALLGDKPDKRSRVWYFNGEDDRDELARRIEASCKHFHVAESDVRGRLFIDSGREQELVVMREERREIRVAVPVVAAIKQTIIANGIDVVIVDPFVSTHGVPENDNGAIDRVAKLWARIADECNCAVEIIHHVKKTEGREVEAEDARGAGALLAAARSVRVLNRMSSTQAQSAGVKEADRFSHFSVSRGKANLAPMGGGLEWRRLQSVPLGNGRGIAEPQDHAGVVVEWEWPSSEALVAEVEPEALKAIKARIGGGDYRANEQANDWAGHVAGQVLRIETDTIDGVRRVRTMLKAWIEQGHLEVVAGKNPKGEPTKLLKPCAVDG